MLFIKINQNNIQELRTEFCIKISIPCLEHWNLSCLVKGQKKVQAEGKFIFY